MSDTRRQYCCTPTMLLFTVVLISVLHVNSGLRLHKGSKYDHVNVYHVEGHIRQKRSNSFHFPDQLSYRFDLPDGSLIELNLLKVRRLNLNIPMWMATGNGEFVKYNLNDNENVGLYQDWKRGSSIMVMCENSIDTCKLYGKFYHNDEYYNIQASDIVRAQPGLTHLISKIGRQGTVLDYAAKPEHDISVSFEINPSDMTEMPQEVMSHGDKLSQSLLSRRKRAGVNDVIELLFYLDSSVFEYFLAEASNIESDAIQNMRLYFTLLQNEINLPFQSFAEADPKFDINVVVNGIVFVKDLSDSSWVQDNLFVYNNLTYLNVLGSIEDMGKYLERNRQIFDVYDHMMHVTRFDLVIKSPGSTWFVDVAGNATLNTICRQSVSVVEDLNFGGVSLDAVQQLAHSLGALLDTGSCDDGYVMGTGNGSKQDATTDHLWKFSPCSMAAIMSTLSEVNCTLIGTYSQDLCDEYMSMDPAGSCYILDQQCKMTFGLNSTFQPEMINFTTMCYTGAVCLDDGEYKLIDLLDRTPCDIGKACYRGECVSLRPEPPTSDTSKCVEGKSYLCTKGVGKRRLCKRLGGSFCRSYWIC